MNLADRLFGPDAIDSDPDLAFILEFCLGAGFDAHRPLALHPVPVAPSFFADPSDPTEELTVIVDEDPDPTDDHALGFAVGWPMRCHECGATWFVDVGRLAAEVSECSCYATDDTGTWPSDDAWEFFDLDLGAWTLGHPPTT